MTVLLNQTTFVDIKAEMPGRMIPHKGWATRGIEREERGDKANRKSVYRSKHSQSVSAEKESNSVGAM